MDERCKNCAYFYQLKLHSREWTPRGIKTNFSCFDVSSCCVALPKEPNSEYEAFALEVTENDMCEMFTPRR